MTALNLSRSNGQASPNCALVVEVFESVFNVALTSLNGAILTIVWAVASAASGDVVTFTVSSQFIQHFSDLVLFGALLLLPEPGLLSFGRNDIRGACAIFPRGVKVQNASCLTF